MLFYSDHTSNFQLACLLRGYSGFLGRCTQPSQACRLFFVLVRLRMSVFELSIIRSSNSSGSRYPYLAVHTNVSGKFNALYVFVIAGQEQ